MREILDSDSAKIARGEFPTLESAEGEAPEAEVEEAEAPAEDVETEQDEEEEGEAPEGDEALVEEPPEGDQPEADEEPGAEEHEDFYLEVSGARYRTREDAERGAEETRRAFLERSQKLAESERENATLREQIAYQQGQASRPSDEGFDEWADAWIEANPDGGLDELIKYAANTGDREPVDNYFDRWVEQDQTGRALSRRIRLETDLVLARMQNAVQPPAPEAEEAHPAQPVIDAVWREVAEEYPDMRDPEMVSGMTELIRNDSEIMNAALTGEPAAVRLAFVQARERVRAQRAGPRRVRKEDAEAVAREKAGAKVVTGDGAPKRRSSSPDMTAEEESILAGAEKLGLKRRE